MCGVCGMALSSREQKPDPVLLDQMTDSLTHRGPDGRGTWCAAHIGLGHRRLAVIGVDTGAQPMRDAARDVAVTFNGEIYNFRTLRQDLENQGAIFRTESDTEVLLQGYVAWGMERLLSRLVGMFAFALWDGRERRLYLVRDRLGVKPLYWAEGTHGDLYFASELRALRRTPVASQELDKVCGNWLPARCSLGLPESPSRSIATGTWPKSGWPDRRRARPKVRRRPRNLISYSIRRWATDWKVRYPLGPSSVVGSTRV